jgi:hypothetical protein
MNGLHLPFYYTIGKFPRVVWKWDALAALLARVFLGVTWHGFRHTLEQAVSPASYPTTPTKRWMGLIADARTGLGLCRLSRGLSKYEDKYIKRLKESQ